MIFILLVGSFLQALPGLADFHLGTGLCDHKWCVCCLWLVGVEVAAAAHHPTVAVTHVMWYPTIDRKQFPGARTLLN